MNKPETIDLRCPDCGRVLRIPLRHNNTYQGARECLCGREWEITAELLRGTLQFVKFTDARQAA
jgi:hypothetical protein